MRVSSITLDDSAALVVDEAGVIRLWAPGMEAAFGYPAARAVGETLDLIVPPEHREAHWTGFRRAMETSVAELDGQVAPFPVRRADGEVVEVPGRLTLMRHPSGEVIGAMVVFGAG